MSIYSNADLFLWLLETIMTIFMLRSKRNKYFFHCVLTPIMIQQPDKKVFDEKTMLLLTNFFRILNYTNSSEYQENNMNKITTRTATTRANTKALVKLLHQWTEITEIMNRNKAKMAISFFFSFATTTIDIRICRYYKRRYL